MCVTAVIFSLCSDNREGVDSFLIEWGDMVASLLKNNWFKNRKKPIDCSILY